MFIQSTVTLLFVNPNGNHVFFSCLECNNHLIITHCCTNELISNISLKTFNNDIDLSHFVSWAPLPSIWRYIYSFTVGDSVDDHGLVVVEIVSPKEEERQSFLQGVSYDCESSLSLPSVWQLWLVLLSYPDYDTYFAPTEASEALFIWVCIGVSKCGGMMTVVLDSVFSFNLS